MVKSTTTDTFAPAATPSVLSPLPVVPSNGYQSGMVRYVRSLKATGHAITAFNTSGSTSGLAPAYVKLVAKTMPVGVKQFRYVVHCHTCNVWLGFQSWSAAYAASMAHGSTALAPSVASSLGKAGLASLGLPGLTVRAKGLQVDAKVAAQAPSPSPMLALNPGPSA